MVIVQASKVPIPNSCSLSSPPFLHSTPSILFEPSSLTLAIAHSDSSLSLYPSFTPPYNTTPTLIPSPSSSSTFLLLQTPSSPTPTVLFLVSSPHRSQILLRFFLLRRSTNSFLHLPRVLCPSNSNTLRFHPSLGVLLHSQHGLSVRVSGSVNYFAVYSASSSRVWLFGAKQCFDDDGHGDEGCVKLMRCAVVECERPIWSLSVRFGFLLLGEENGVGVFGLRRLVKGKVVAKRAGNSKLVRIGGKRAEGVLEMARCNGELDGRIEKHGVAAAKQANAKFKHNRDGGACFVALKGNDVETKSTTKVSRSVKAISIQALSQGRFLILDSHGDLHLLCLSNSGIGVDITGNVRQLPHIMKVKSLAVLPDVSNTMSQTIWISDGCHSVHMFTTVDMEKALNESDENDSAEKLRHLSVAQVLFSGEKIQDIISIASNSILILGQGSLYAYAIS